MFRRLSEKLSAYFRLEERNTTIRTEVLAGLTTFITVAYILILLLTGKAKQIKPLTVIVALIFIARYAFMTLG